jgi:hypothetical protein
MKIPKQPKQLAITVILIAALLAFELFNFDTTRYGLNHLFGKLTFVALDWGTILAAAFCAIDLAGLLHLFTPGQNRNESNEGWLLMGAWLLAATMNAMMTWYTVSVVIAGRPISTSTVSQEAMLFYAPIFIAMMVWLTRILFIGAISIASDRLVGKSSRAGSVKTIQPRATRSANGRVEQPELLERK